MDKVAILARVSTDKQEYRRQVNELKSFCQKMDWEIIGTFTNKISGAESLENRKELIEMIEFVRSKMCKEWYVSKSAASAATLSKHSK